MDLTAKLLVDLVIVETETSERIHPFPWKNAEGKIHGNVGLSNSKIRNQDQGLIRIHTLLEMLIFLYVATYFLCYVNLFVAFCNMRYISPWRWKRY